MFKKFSLRHPLFQSPLFFLLALGVTSNFFSDYIPNVTNNDLFNLNLHPDYSYVATNPPYTRQEEMSMAYYNKDYKINRRIIKIDKNYLRLLISLF